MDHSCGVAWSDEHEGVTCAAFRAAAAPPDPESQKLLAAALPCPGASCQQGLLKVDGCNKIICSQCKKVAAARPSRTTRLVTRAGLEPYLQVCSGTAIMLALGRFAFMPLHRRDLQRSATAAGPKTTGSTYFDSLQQEASFITSTNDPAGFTLIDTMAWGALGHALGFAILAATSSGVIPGVSGP
ncbi:hypothetical protein OEZ86_014089 [Tetradesmus obliquus]|nr:hypothetical protein OEZ86_014089 [Tetradesmus obliquus]